MMKELKQLYFNKYSENSEDLLNSRVLNTLKLLFRKLNLELKGDFLDLGCGTGGFFKYLNRQGFKATGIDLGDGVNFENDKLPYKDDSFDIVFMYSVIEHLVNPSNIIEEIKRIARPNGILIIITPNINTALGTFYNDPTHVKPYNPVGLDYLMGLFKLKKLFIGLWTVNKPWIWRLPANYQFFLGKILPFSGLNKFAPAFLKGKSKSMLAVFKIK